jgi:D-arabinan exo alpha-(1,3)/(1,5)-arabinofuranosidase (non-reducing end)
VLAIMLALCTPVGSWFTQSASAPPVSQSWSAPTVRALSTTRMGGTGGKGPVGWDIYRQLDRLPELTTTVQTKQFSSFDRLGGNDDGSGGTWSCLRRFDGCVIAETQGAGEVESMWFTRNSGDVTETGNIRIELDGVTVLDAPLQEVVDGRIGAPFTFPLVANADQSSGGVYIKVPMPYRESMRITTGSDPRFYHVSYRQFADAEGVRTFDPTDGAQDVVTLLRDYGTRDPKPAQPGVETLTRSFALAPGASVTLAEATGPGMISQLRLRIPQVVGRELNRIGDDGRAFGPQGASEFTVSINPANDGVRLTRRLNTLAGNQRADVLVDSVVVARWLGLASTAVGRWADEIVDLPPYATAGKSAITIRNRFVSSDFDFNEFHYWVDARVGGTLQRTDEVDVGTKHSDDEAAHHYRIENQTYSGTALFAYPRPPDEIAAEAARIATSDAVLRDARVRITFDGIRSVDAPLGEFFGSGLGEYPVRSLFFTMEVTPDGSYYAWWPMPYQRDANVELYNGSEVPIEAGDAGVTVSHDSRWLAALSPIGEAGRFHATSSRGETKTGSDWLFLDAAGRGKVVGVSHTFEHAAASVDIRNYLEGDERVYIDGARTPQIHGTGTEDFYEAGWYFNRGAFSAPFNGHAAEEAREAGCRKECDSAYRLMVGDSVPFGIALRFGIEHGPRNDEPAIYGSTAFSYEQPRYALKRSDVLDVGDAVSERAHGYTGGEGAPWTLSATFEGDDDMVVQSDRGRAASLAVEFTLATERRNAGVRLRRLSDQAQPYQAVRVLVNGRQAGIWLQPLGNSSHRWLEDAFDLPPALTAGRRELNIRLEPLPEASAWQAARYEAFAHVMPYIDRKPPAEVTGLVVTGGATNAIHLTWVPAFDESVVRNEVYASRFPDVGIRPDAMVGVTGSNGFDHEDLGFGEMWYYRVRAVDTSGNAGAPSATASATTGNVLSVEAELLLPSETASARSSPGWRRSATRNAQPEDR